MTICNMSYFYRPFKANIALDSVSGSCYHHDVELDKHLIVRSEKYPNLFFRNERARFWGDNTVDKTRQTCTDYLGTKSKIENKNYLLIHPLDDNRDVPPDYDGQVIQYEKETPNFSN